MAQFLITKIAEKGAASAVPVIGWIYGITSTTIDLISLGSTAYVAVQTGGLGLAALAGKEAAKDCLKKAIAKGAEIPNKSFVEEISEIQSSDVTSYINSNNDNSFLADPYSYDA